MNIVRWLLVYYYITEKKLRQIDFITVFLNALMDNEFIYIEQSHGWEVGSDLICRLLRALYGLKQASMLWQKTLQLLIRKYGFSPSLADPCFYTRDGLIVAVQINDILVVAIIDDELNQLV